MYIAMNRFKIVKGREPEFEISWKWVKAHSTDELNNEVDLLARDAANL